MTEPTVQITSFEYTDYGLAILAQINEREGYVGEAESQAFLDGILEEPTDG